MPAPPAAASAPSPSSINPRTRFDQLRVDWLTAHKGFAQSDTGTCLHFEYVSWRSKYK